MTTDQLMRQIARLKVRFGDRAFDPESVKLVYREVSTMNEAEFMGVVDVLISSRPPNKPPLIVDFRDAVRTSNNRKFQSDVRGASLALHRDIDRGGLRKFLDERFGKGCKSISEAIEIRKLAIQTKRAEDPSYDPMKDHEWN